MYIAAEMTSITKEYPPLPRHENDELLKQAKETGDTWLREKFFMHNLKLMIHLARKWESTGIHQDELFGIAQIGFLKGFNTFDLDKGVQFATYAARCIDNEVLMNVRKGKKHKGHHSLEDILNVDVDGHTFALEDVLPAEADEYAFEQEEKDAEFDALMAEFTKKNSPRDVKLIKMLYFKDMTQKEASEALGISQSYVSRMEKRMLRKLKNIALSLGIGEKTKEAYTELGTIVKKPNKLSKGAESAMKREAKKRGAMLNRGHVKWMIENTCLTDKQVGEIMECSPVTIFSYRKMHVEGGLDDVMADPSIEPAYKAFRSTITGEHLVRLEGREKRKAGGKTPSKVKTYFITPEPSVAKKPAQEPVAACAPEPEKEVTPPAPMIIMPEAAVKVVAVNQDFVEPVKKLISLMDKLNPEETKTFVEHFDRAAQDYDQLTALEAQHVPEEVYAEFSEELGEQEAAPASEGAQSIGIGLEGVTVSDIADFLEVFMLKLSRGQRYDFKVVAEKSE